MGHSGVVPQPPSGRDTLPDSATKSTNSFFSPFVVVSFEAIENNFGASPALTLIILPLFYSNQLVLLFLYFFPDTTLHLKPSHPDHNPR